MKQRLTVGELNKLPDAQKEQLREWWNPTRGDFALAWSIGTDGVIYKHSEIVIGQSTSWDKGEDQYFTYDAPETFDNDGSCDYYRKECMLPLLSIGQMIQFIQEKKPLLKGISKNRFDKWFVNIDNGMLGYKDELCDALFETVKQLLKA